MTDHSLIDFLMKHQAKSPVSFHMPGHKGMAFFRRFGYGDVLDHLADIDITEIPGADNLFQPESVIADLMEQYRCLYRSCASYLLVGGSSAGIVASIIAAAAKARQAGIWKPSFIIARNSHKSVYSGLTLAGASPVYVRPQILPDWGIAGPVTAQSVRRAIDQAPDAAAVIITSPNYYGICSDISSIADVCHRADMPLIVDEAHGAHLIMMDRLHPSDPPRSAALQGADAVINSTHKTLASFTQSAVLNLYSDRIDLKEAEYALEMIQSSSPSYLLMTSLAMNAAVLEEHGQELMEQWKEDVLWFRSAAQAVPGLGILEDPFLDQTKLDLDMSGRGLTGMGLQDELMKRNIYPELASGNIVMCLTGIGNVREDYEYLLKALKEIAGSFTDSERTENASLDDEIDEMDSLPERTTLPLQSEEIPLAASAGRICARPIVPYPPGIPLVCPGEVLEFQVIRRIEHMLDRGESVMGVSLEREILVGEVK